MTITLTLTLTLTLHGTNLAVVPVLTLLWYHAQMTINIWGQGLGLVTLGSITRRYTASIALFFHPPDPGDPPDFSPAS